ncbi:MAG: methionine aminotransferase [Gammaproteobacteria bacterium]|nr:methionine aminotransferase [Gammaproteobacteria bacterium]
MSKLAVEANALNLSQGFPDFDCPRELIENVSRAMRDGLNQYPPMAGVAKLREAIAGKVLDLYGATLDPEREITVTSGATQALYSAITAVVRAGDEVIMFDPAYDAYEPAVNLNGGVCVHLPLTPPEFSVDWDRVRDAITDRTRLLIMNSPHNPTGTTWTERDIEALRDVIAGRDLYLVSDEVYEHIVFDGRMHPSLTRYPDLYARSFVVSSFGKTYHATGWKVGYCCAPPALTEALRGIHQWIVFTTTSPLQHGIADFMVDHPEHHRELSAFYQAKRDLFCDLLEDSRFGYTRASGTYFQLVDYSEISDESDVDVARRLTFEHKIASIPLSVLYEAPPDQTYLRFCFAKTDETLEQAADILCRL